MPSRILVIGLALALGACAHRPISNAAALLPPAQERFGPAADIRDAIAPGIIDVTSSDVDLRLPAPAYVIAFRVTRELGIQLVAPLSGSPRSKPGVHYFRASATAEVQASNELPASVSSRPCTGRPDARESCWVPSHHISQLLAGAPPEADGYWLLIVSDTPTQAHDIMRQLEMTSLPDTNLVDLVRRIPEPLMASRTQRWAAYYASFTRSAER